MLEDAAGCSAMRMIPRINNKLTEVTADFKFLRAELRKDKGCLGVTDRLYVDCYLLSELVKLLCATVAAVFALYIKVKSHQIMIDLPLGQWHRKHWVKLFAFANQVSGLTPLAKICKSAFLDSVFTSEDAEWKGYQERALAEFLGMLHKQIFHHFPGVRGFVVSLTIGQTDLQKILFQNLSMAAKKECTLETDASSSRKNVRETHAGLSLSSDDRARKRRKRGCPE
eukprot:gnl/TRDRNA2_/TRDRNA2_208056_c0_seq1.p1 gnl/TRDRNA2_/TRDRNA2_208056_c0~~gnl/TRDRNA2_/TRDRNA2_208056_c0_seq1.p1  ORF type:complete len:226 (+),score=16.28 gnl/TRDRNA2_/TRDRNA2_208056_c0_seq1:1-678(+)